VGGVERFQGAIERFLGVGARLDFAGRLRYGQQGVEGLVAALPRR
jgi:hypothetical protein